MAKNDIATKESSTAIAMVSNFEQDAASSFAGMGQEDFALSVSETAH
jgi:hypothetical protein